MDPRLAPKPKEKKTKGKEKVMEGGPSQAPAHVDRKGKRKDQVVAKKKVTAPVKVVKKYPGEKRSQGQKDSEVKAKPSKKPESQSAALKNLAKGKDVIFALLKATPKPKEKRGETPPQPTTVSPAKPFKVVEVCAFLQTKKHKSQVSPGFHLAKALPLELLLKFLSLKRFLNLQFRWLMRSL